MNRGGGVHTVPNPNGRGWWNKYDGKVLSRHRTKDVAVAAGRAIAKQLEGEHSIHREDDAITAKNSYGNEPNPPKDEN